MLAWWLLPETLPPERRLRRSPMTLIGDFGRIAAERGFLTNAVMGGAAMFTVFAFIGGAPEVYIEQYGIAPTQFGLLFALSATGYIGATQLNPWLLGRVGHLAPRYALFTALLSVLALAASAFTGLGGFMGLYLPACLALACTGLVFPNAAVGALAHHAMRAGSASALLGTLQFGLAALGAALVGALTEDTAQPMAVLMVLGIGVAVLAERLRR